MMTGNVIDLQFIEDRLKNLEGEDAEMSTVQRETIETKPSDTTSIAPTYLSRASRAKSAISRDGKKKLSLKQRAHFTKNSDKVSRISSAVTKASVKTYISKLEDDLNHEKVARKKI